MNKEKTIKYLTITLIIITVFISIISRVITFDKIGLNGADATSHFYDMKKYYESDTLPVTGARFEMGGLLDNSKPRVPGGFFYLHYLICYKLGGGDVDKARVWNYISMLIPVLIFLFWVFKRFSITIGAIVSSLVLMNAYYFATNISFYNPNLTLALSFLFLPIFAEYTLQKNNNIAAILIFPILAYMAQSHFAVFYGLVPTVIVYMLIRFKNTKKNIKYLLISVFMAFLSYLPYLVYEIRNNFSNIKNMLAFSEFKGERASMGFPQVHSLFMFPTDEFSVLYTGNTFKKLMAFWLEDNKYAVLGLPVMIISVLLVLSILIFVLVKYFKNRSFKFNNTYEKLKDDNLVILNELILLFLLYFPVTIAVTMIGQGVSGHYRYHYGAFALSFTPFIYFLYWAYKNKKNNILLAILLFYIVNTISMHTNMLTYFKKFEEPNLWKPKRETALEIGKDANGSPFTLITDNPYFYELGIAYNKTGYWNEITNTNGIMYYVQDPHRYTNVEGRLIISNQFFIVNRVDK